MLLITFKRTYGSKDLFISDMPYDFRISHNSFVLPENKIPLESLQFKQLLNTGQLKVVRIEGDGPRKSYFEKYYKPDAEIIAQEKKQEEIRKEEIAKKEEKIKEEEIIKVQKEKIKEEKKLAGMKKEEVVIDEDDVEDLVDDFLAYDE